MIAGVGITACIALVAALFGFIWFPLQTTAQWHGVWDAICSAAGVVSQPPAGQPIVESSFRTTQVEIAPGMLRGADAEAIGRGATLALRCTMCHGARGLSRADSPNLAGQYAVGIYKQLHDFKSGARTSAVMQPLMTDLSDENMRDLALYYAYLPRPAADHPAGAASPPAIVVSGAPMRGIAPCGACHGTLDNKAASPSLEGQPSAYLEAQLRAFASGARHNDIDGLMRNVAHAMTPDEMTAAVRWYAASQP
jgi:cytochrome c553